MKTHSDAHDALAPLREAKVPSGELERLAAAEERVAERLRSVMREAPSAAPPWRRPRVAIWAAAAAVCMAGAGVGLNARLGEKDAGPIVRVLRGRATLYEAGERQALLADDGLSAIAGELEAGAEGVTISAASGIVLDLSRGSRVSLEDLTAPAEGGVRLLHGSVSCRVAPQEGKRRFSVLTPDVRVVVHGTAFSVTFDSSAPEARTCVRVSEGVVSVHQPESHRLLSAGMEYGCSVPKVDEDSTAPSAPSGAIAPSDRTSLPLATPRQTERPRRAPEPAAPAAPAEDSEPSPVLSEQNRLLRAALAAEHRGDFAAARANIRTLLQQHPDSPLSAEARIVLKRLERSEANHKSRERR